MRSSKTGRKTPSVAWDVWQVTPSCWNQMLSISSSSIFMNKNFFRHGLITIAIDCNDISLLIFEAKWPSYASGPKCALYSDSFWVRAGFRCPKFDHFACLHTRQDQNADEAQMKILQKLASSVSRSQAHFSALFERIHNHIRSAKG